jgi:trigger factor
MGKSYEDMLAEWRPDVEKALKSRLIVDTLIKDLGITATDEELEVEMQSMAEGMNTSIDEVKKYYEQEHMKEYLREDVKERKLFDTLIAEAKVKKGKKQKYLDLMGNNR